MALLMLQPLLFLKLVGLLYVTLGLSKQVNATPQYLMELGESGNCGQTIQNQNSAYIKSHLQAGQVDGLVSYKSNEDCELTFDAGNGRYVLLQFKTFELQTMKGSHCQDLLNITDLANDTTMASLCGIQVPASPIISTGRNITLHFTTDVATELRGFSLLVTVFEVGKCVEFNCDTDRCISALLKCDGDSNCVDETDEEGCATNLLPEWDFTELLTADGQYAVLAIIILVCGTVFAIFVGVVLYGFVGKRSSKPVNNITVQAINKPAQTEQLEKATSPKKSPKTNSHRSSSKTSPSPRGSDRNKQVTPRSINRNPVVQPPGIVLSGSQDEILW